MLRKILLNVYSPKQVDGHEQAGEDSLNMPGGINIALRIDQMRFDERVTQAKEPRPFDLLISRAREGDLVAFDQIIIAHQQRVLGIAWRMLGNQDDAQDAAQETFLRVYKHLNNFDTKQDFSGWLYRITVNVCRDLARKRGGENPVSLDAEREAGNFAEPVSPHNTEHSAMHAQERAIIARAVTTSNNLPPQSNTPQKMLCTHAPPRVGLAQ